MMKYRVILFNLLLFSNIVYGSSQLDYKALQFDSLTIEQGLPAKFISDVLQDKRGVIWLASKSGLIEYDGMRFKLYTHDPNNPNTPSANYVWKIRQTADGGLWLATWGKGLDRYDITTRTFTNYQHDPTNPHSIAGNMIEDVFEDSQGRLWVSVYKAGMNRFDPETERFTHYPPDPNNPNSIQNGFVKEFTEDQQGNLWISFMGEGIDRFDPVTEIFHHYKLNDGSGKAKIIFIDSRNDIWVGTNIGLSHYDKQKDAFSYLPLPQYDIGYFVEDESGLLWITGQDGLLLFDPVKRTYLVHYPSNPSAFYGLNIPEGVQDILHDEQGMYWLATNLGIERIVPWHKSIIHYHSDNIGLINNAVHSLYQDEANLLWIGTEKGLIRFNRQTLSTKLYQHDPQHSFSLSNNKINHIIADKQGHLWIATGGGIKHFKPDTEQFTHYQHQANNPNSLADDVINSLAFDKAGMLWIAVNVTGLSRLDPTTGKITNFIYDPDNPKGQTGPWGDVVLVDSQNKIWLGSDGGLSRYDPLTEHFTNYNQINNMPLSDIGIFSLAESPDGIIWVGSTNGLNRIDVKQQTIEHYFKKDGLAGNHISAIVPVENGELWISTTEGISRFNPKTKQFRNYDVRDGLQSNFFHHQAAYLTQDGELLFGGSNGISAFYPEQLRDNPHPPKVIFSDFQLFNQPVSIGKDSVLKQDISFTKQIQLEHWQNVFTLGFSALNYYHPDKTQFAYRMKGFNQDWVTTDITRRFATYTNLDSGVYQFQVKATNNDGVWTEQPTSIQIVITPPWWETWWFRASALLLIVLIIGFAVRWRIQSLKAYQYRLEQIVNERTAELQSSEARFASVMNSMEAIMYVADMDTYELLFINDYTRQLIGDVEGQICWQVLQAGQTQPCDFCTNQYLVKNGKPTGIYNWEHQNTRSQRWYQVQDQAIYWPDGRLVRLEIATDVSELKNTEAALQLAKERAEQANKAKSTFLTAMSHELRTPLNAVLGYTKILRRQPELLHEGARVIEQSGKHLLDLINDLLDLAKIEVGKLNLEPHPVNLAVLLRDTINIIRPRAEEKKLRLDLQLEGVLPTSVETDAKRLRQILLNLLTNAVKFTDNGEIVLKVMISISNDVAHTQFSVKDSGIGIPEDKQKLIFQSFKQIQAAHRDNEGIGLGLNISRRLVNLMGGDIQVQSVLNQGSCFSFSLDLPMSTVQLPSHYSTRQTIIGYQGTPIHILVVDDNKDNRAVLRTLLEPVGFIMSEAANGLEAIQQVKQAKPQIILMDLLMPELDGVAATQQIHALPACSDLPIIAVSASFPEHMETNFNGFLHKPLDEDKLWPLLEQTLNINWLHEETSKHPDSKMLIPSTRELQKLHDLALLGKMSAIRTWAKTLQPEYTAFAHQVNTLASAFDNTGLVKLAKQYL